MGLGRYVVDAVLLEGRSPREVAKAHGISKTWIYELLARYKAGGYEALGPRSRRPRSCAHATPPKVERAILKLRKDLIARGHDAGPATIAHHLRRTVDPVPAVATIWRVLRRHGLITPQPQKRPKSSFIRFEAALPNEMWQGDTTHWTLAGGTDVEILDLIDDHSRLALDSVAFPTVKAADAVGVFTAAAARYGLPAAVLTDNGAVFTASYRGRGKVLWETELERLGIRAVRSTPYHPRTCGKVERFHQTVKRFLRKQPPARTIAELQAQLDAFRAYYNQRRPHRALKGRAPLQAFHARTKARPELPAPPVHFRVRQDKIDSSGRVTLRYESVLRHIYVGRRYSGETIRLLVADANVRIIRATGELLSEVTLDRDRRYFSALRSVHNVVRQVSVMS